MSGVLASELEKDEARNERFQNFLGEVQKRADAGWTKQLRIVTLDARCGSTFRVLSHFQALDDPVKERTPNIFSQNDGPVSSSNR